MPDMDALSLLVRITELAPGLVLLELAPDKDYGCTLVLELTEDEREKRGMNA